MLARKVILSCAILLCFAGFGIAQDTPVDESLAPPVETTVAEEIPAGGIPAEGTSAEGGVSVGMDSSLGQANQAFLSLYNRQFAMAKQQYDAAATSNPEYRKMVDFCQNILDRMRDLSEEYMGIYGKVMSPNFRIEQLKTEEVERMLDFQLRQNQAGQSLGEIGMIADIPVSDLGLDFEGADQLSLGEYVMWIKPRSANERIWYRARKRVLARSMVYAKQEVKQQQRQEHYSRLEESRRRRLDSRSQGGSMGVGGGGMGGDFGGMMGGGMGGGMMGGMGGMGGGMGMGMGGGMGF